MIDLRENLSVWTLRTLVTLSSPGSYSVLHVHVHFSRIFLLFFPKQGVFFSAASILERDKAPGFKLDRCLSCDFLRWYHCNKLLFLKLSFNYSACKSIPLVWRSVVSYTFKSRLVISKAFSFAVNHCNMWSHS